MLSWMFKILMVLCLVGVESAMAAISSPSASSDSTNLYYQFTYSGTPSFYRAFLDTDKSSSTGYAISGIGANYLLENGTLYRYSGTGGAWGWTYVKAVTMTNSNLTVRWTVAKTDVGSPAGVNLIFQHDNPATSSAVISQTVTTVVANSIALSVAGAPNLPYNGTSTLVTVGFTGATPSKVTLARDGLAAFATWPGGTFFTLSSDGKSISGNWCISASCWGNQPGTHVLTAVATYADGSTKSSSVTLNVADTTVTTTTTTTLAAPTSAWTFCANEGGYCSFSGTRTVRYGDGSSYYTTVATGGIACDNATFGDPLVGIAKHCDFSNTTTTTTTTMQIVTTTTLPAPTTTTTTMVSSSGPTYYVSPSGNDFNSGSASAPWKTIQQAVNSVSAGATILLMDGTYEERSISISRSGTATAPITIKAQHKWMATLASTSSCNPGISISASYITLQDFRLSVSPANATCANYTSSNVHVRAWNVSEPTPSNPTTGYVGFVLRGMKIDGGAGRSEGVKSNQDFTIMENNESSNSMELFNNKNSFIRNNVFLGQGGSGISIFAKGGLRNAQIYGNVIHQKAANGNGIIIGGYSCDTCHFDTSTNIEAYNVVAFNNVVINESGGNIAGLTLQGAKDSAFYNNVVIKGQISMLLGGHNTGPQAPVTNPTFKNNIFVCGGGAVTSGYFGWSYSGTLNLDYNNFDSCSSSVAQAHAIVGSPMFVNQLSDWHLQSGSPAINTGTVVTMPAYGGGSLDVSRDFNGVTRTTPWDLGIYNTP